MNLPCRKINRLESYDYSQNGAYFITICTQDRKHILSKISVGDGFPVPMLTACGNAVSKYIAQIERKYENVFVDKYVILPNHIHILLRLDSYRNGTGNLSPTVGNVIGWFKYQTTKECNNIRMTQGQRFWQRSYYDHVIRNDMDYREIWEYIDNNSRKWELDKFYFP